MKNIKKSIEVLGSVIEINIVSDKLEDAELAIDKAFDECKRIEREYSRFLEKNQLSELNSQLNKWVKVSKEFFQLIEFATNINQQTGGAFDLNVKRILDAIGYDKNYSFIEKLDRQNIKIGQIDIDKKNEKIKLSSEIEIGGLGKGYALDRMAEILKHFENICINAGGDIFIKGQNEFGNPWKILFENPLNVSEAIGFVESSNLFLASSSANKRSWGKNKHHLINPKLLNSADDMLAVYTQAKSGIIADAYSTALFVMGYDDAKQNLSQYPIEAMLISKNGEIFKTLQFLGELFHE